MKLSFNRKAKAAALAVVLSLGSFLLVAADHLDGPSASADKAADITDVYAWMQDADKINLIMNVHPLADSTSKFSDSVQYVFHVNSSASYGAAQTETKLVCVFEEDQKVSCYVGETAVVEEADASATTGASSADGKFKVFAGLRNDPFFFDLDNFNLTRTTVRDAASSLTFDTAGCPTLDGATRATLVATVTGSGGGATGTHNPGQDFFGSLNVLSIVVQADRTLFGNGPVYSVWGSTHTY
jgi:hypothetical protein